MNKIKHDITDSSFTPKNVFEVLKQKGIKAKFGSEIFDLCMWLVSFINFKMVYFKEQTIELSSTFLKRYCSNNLYSTVLTILLELGIIKQTANYNVNLHTCKRYVIAEKFLPDSKNYIKPRFYRSETFLRRLAKNKLKKDVQNKLNKNLENDMLYRILQNNITFDSDSAFEYIEATYHLNTVEYQTRFNFISMLKENFVWGKYGNNCNRFYSTYTQMPSDLRPFIIIDGIITDKIYFDISNCHFQLLVHSILRKKLNFSENKDSQLFFNLITNKEKDFYTEMVKLFDVEISRDTMKTIFAIILYSNCQYSPDTKTHNSIPVELIKQVNKKFEKLFPTIAKFLKDSKKKNSSKKAKEMRSEFALLLQNTEAEFMLNKVAKRLIKEGVSVVTIHDGFIVNQEFEEIAEKVFVEESLTAFNTVLKFKKDIV